MPAKPSEVMVKTNPILQSGLVTVSPRHASPHVHPAFQEHTHPSWAVWRSDKCLSELHEEGTHILKEINIPKKQKNKPKNISRVSFCYSWNIKGGKFGAVQEDRTGAACRRPDCNVSSFFLQLKSAVWKITNWYVCQGQPSAPDLIQNQQEWERK